MAFSTTSGYYEYQVMQTAALLVFWGSPWEQGLVSSASLTLRYVKGFHLASNIHIAGLDLALAPYLNVLQVTFDICSLIMDRRKPQMNGQLIVNVFGC